MLEIWNEDLGTFNRTLLELKSNTMSKIKYSALLQSHLTGIEIKLWKLLLSRTGYLQSHLTGIEIGLGGSFKNALPSLQSHLTGIEINDMVEILKTYPTFNRTLLELKY